MASLIKELQFMDYAMGPLIEKLTLLDFRHRFTGGSCETESSGFCLRCVISARGSYFPGIILTITARAFRINARSARGILNRFPMFRPRRR